MRHSIGLKPPFHPYKKVKKMKTKTSLVLITLASLFLSSCAQRFTNTRYDASELGVATGIVYGEILQVSEVTVNGENGTIGAIAGGVIGGALGTTIGGVPQAQIAGGVAGCRGRCRFGIPNRKIN